MTTRFFKVQHKAGAFIDGMFYPPADESLDVRASIVPLEIPADAPSPLWGVEVDAAGNEIGVAQPSARDKMGDALGNSLAGKEPATATGDAKEADERKKTIIETLELLDHSDDDHWTKGGEARIDVVEEASGLENLTRKEIKNASPDFARKAAE